MTSEGEVRKEKRARAPNRSFDQRELELKEKLVKLKKRRQTAEAAAEIKLKLVLGAAFLDQLLSTDGQRRRDLLAVYLKTSEDLQFVNDRLAIMIERKSESAKKQPETVAKTVPASNVEQPASHSARDGERNSLPPFPRG